MLDLLPAVPYYTGHLCRALAEIRDIDVTLASATYAHDPRCFDRLGVTPMRSLISLGHGLRWSALRRIVRLFEMLLNLVLLSVTVVSSRPDVVHVQFTPLLERLLPFELWFIRLAKLAGCGIIVTVHNVLPHIPKPRHRSAYARLYELADILICHDETAKSRIAQEFPVAPECTAVVPHGPLFSHMGELTPQQARTELRLPHNRTLVLWQGIIRPYKGVRFLLQTWQSVARQHPEALLLIVGTGEDSELQAIVRHIDELGIGDSVQCVFRFISVEELKAYHTAADIVVYPYESITSSGALLTGMGHGKATVASALPAFEQLLANECTALVVPFGDRVAWAAALDRLLSDEPLRLRIGRALRDSLDRTLSWNDIALSTCCLYRKLAAERAGARPCPAVTTDVSNAGGTRP